MLNVSLGVLTKAGLQADKFRHRQSNHWRRRIHAIFERCNDLKGKRVIDVGCGVGTFAILTMQYNVKWSLGIDADIEMLKEARVLAKEFGVRPFFLCADVMSIPLSAGTVDLIISADLVEHLNFKQIIPWLKECRRLLDQNGILLLHTWPTRYSYLFETWPSIFLKYFIFLGEHRYEKLLKYIDQLLKYLTPGLEKKGLGWAVSHKNLLTRKILEDSIKKAGFSRVKVESLNLYKGYDFGDNKWRRKSERIFTKFEFFCPNLLAVAQK